MLILNQAGDEAFNMENIVSLTYEPRRKTNGDIRWKIMASLADDSERYLGEYPTESEAKDAFLFIIKEYDNGKSVITTPESIYED